MNSMTRGIAGIALPLALMACAGTPMANLPAGSAAPSASSPQTADARLNAFLDAAYDESLALSPQAMTGEGLRTDYDKLDDASDAAAERALALRQRQLSAMRAQFDPATLSPAGRLSFRLFEYDVADDADLLRWRSNRLPVTNNGSVLSSLPAFMINEHAIDSVADAQAYVSRLTQVERQFGQVADRVDAQAARGVIPAKFNFEPVANNGRRVITGAPFDNGPDSPLWKDFKAKVEKLDAPAAEKGKLLADARAALTGPVKRGYERLIGTMQALEPRAPAEAPASSRPDGHAFYDAALKSSTTTNLTAEQIHRIGLSEVARIHGEMRAIQKRIGDTRTLPQLFAFIRDDPRFEYPNTDAGRAQYLADATATINRVLTVAPKWFAVLPKAKLEVRAVEAYRQQTASTAFYNQPAIDGSRPGIYYVNLADMRQVIKPQGPAFALHEGAPGHHFQIARAQEMTDLPKFRARGGHGAYIEGWGLYSEGLGKEMGFYQDPYEDIARLSAELWRAVRLVVDTGIHAKGWTRQHALDYFLANCLISELDAKREIDRYINNPGQATSYKIGQLKIVELRRRAEAALGPKFDVRAFHEVVLGSGSLPLDVLEEQVDGWIAGQR